MFFISIGYSHRMSGVFYILPNKNFLYLDNIKKLKSPFVLHNWSFQSLSPYKNSYKNNTDVAANHSHPSSNCCILVSKISDSTLPSPDFCHLPF